MLVFFFNDTATTEIYMYGHTLSLHDSLPIHIAISCRKTARRTICSATMIGATPWSISTASPRCSRSPATGSARWRPGPNCRSEEHTSELQSLMRISYAVFCLQKKQYEPTTYTTSQRKNKSNISSLPLH